MYDVHKVVLICNYGHWRAFLRSTWHSTLHLVCMGVGGLVVVLAAVVAMKCSGVGGSVVEMVVIITTSYPHVGQIYLLLLVLLLLCYALNKPIESIFLSV